MIHKQNYCSKRLLISSASSESYSSSNSSRSNSRSPNRTTSDDTNNQNDIKQLKKQAQAQIRIENSFGQNSYNEERSSNRTDVQLVKSTIYQCNSCLFQTDKKSIMNRHSRVHLAQKRKSMESFSSDQNSNADELKPRQNSQDQEEITSVVIQKQCDILKNFGNSELKEQKDSKPNDSQNQSYCSDCDIQFSSISTFQHHRSNYCQKYKTIEAIVPVDLVNCSNVTNNGIAVQEPSKYQAKVAQESRIQTSSSNKKAKTQFFNNNDNNVFEQTINNHIQSKPFVPEDKTSSLGGAVRMGDMVYLPLFKLSSQQVQNRLQKPEQLINSRECVPNEQLVSMS